MHGARTLLCAETASMAFGPNGTQVAVWSIDRNGFSFSRAAIDLLHEHGALKTVHLHDDVSWKGDVFAQLVKKADAGIRLGDDVRRIQGDRCIGLARATAGWLNGTVRRVRLQNPTSGKRIHEPTTPRSAE